MKSESDYWLAWSGCPDLGPVRFNHLLTHFQTAETAWKASESKLRKIGLKGKWLNNFLTYRSNFDWQKLQHSMHKWGIEYISQKDQSYPEKLNQIDKAPIGLYVMGGTGRHSGAKPSGVIETYNVNDSEKSIGSPPMGVSTRRLDSSSKQGKPQEIAPKGDLNTLLLAVVGTRKITSYGRMVTTKLTHQLVDSGLGVISGLMYGVDEAAHRACIDAGGFTIGVWAGGLDTLFRGSRKHLSELILINGGILISEFPVGMQPSAQTFPYRNRIVAGMSSGVLVTEGSERSGTLITAGYAAEQGREVFAVPGPITSQQSVAPSKLIKSGAKMVTTVEDILEEFSDAEPSFVRPQGNISGDGEASPVGARRRVGTRATPTEPTQQRVIELLKNELLSSDELSRKLLITSHKLGATLGMMELHGWIFQEGGKWQVK